MTSDYRRERDNQQSPARLPTEIEDFVTRGLGEFAHEAGFDLISLYHDESIWLLKRHRDRLVQRIQVSAFGEWPFVQLRFIPDAMTVDENQRVLRTMSDVPDEYIQSLPWPAFYPPVEKPYSVVDMARSAAKYLDYIHEDQLDVTVPLTSTQNNA